MYKSFKWQAKVTLSFFSLRVSFGRFLCCSLMVFFSIFLVMDAFFFSFARFLIFHLNDLLANAEQVEVIFILFVVSPCFWPFLISLTLSVCAKENKALFLSHLQIKFIGKSYNNLLKNNGLWQKSFLISKALVCPSTHKFVFFSAHCV